MNSEDIETSFDLYFGNDQQQSDVITALEKSVAMGKSQLHLVCGGTVTGKTSAIQTVVENLDRNDRFSSEMDIEYSLPKLRELLRQMNDGKDGPDVQHHIYKDKNSDLFIMIADGETPPSDRKGNGWIRKIAELVSDAHKQGYEIVWVADAPIMHQKASVFLSNPHGQKCLSDHNLTVQRLEKDFKGIIQTHTLTYDPRNIRECLWEHITDPEEGGGVSFLKGLKTSGHWDTSPEWKKARDYALKNDREGYDRAFDVLAKREEDRSRRP